MDNTDHSAFCEEGGFLKIKYELIDGIATKKANKWTFDEHHLPHISFSF